VISELPRADDLTRVLIAPTNLIRSDGSFLKRKTISVHMVNDNAQALLAAERWLPHLIVFRADATGEEAWQFCRVLKLEARDPAPKLLMVTDQVLLDRQQAFEAAYDAHLISPISEGQLLSTMAELLDIKERRMPRVPLDVLVHTEGFESGGAVDVSLCNALAVSEESMMLEASRQLGVGTRGRLLFFLPGSEERLSLDSLVRVAVDEVRLIYVIEFVDLPPQHRTQIRRYVAAKKAA
jgi:CheY-like chemotaxis protein